MGDDPGHAYVLDAEFFRHEGNLAAGLPEFDNQAYAGIDAVGCPAAAARGDAM